MKKKYCIFSAQYLPHLGGVERYTYNMAKKLSERGNDVTIVTMNEIKRFSKEEDDGITILRLPGIQLCNERMPIIKLGKEFFVWNDYLQKQEYDLIIIQTRYYPLTLYAARYAKKKKIPSILIDHSTAHIEVGNKLVDSFIVLYEHVMCFMIKKYNCDFYGVSRACSKWLEHFRIKAKGVLYNSVNIDEINRISVDNHLIYEEFKIPKDADIILYAGRLVKEKGVQKLVDAMKDLQSAYPKLYLVIAGDGELLEELQKNKIHNCIILGAVSHDRVMQLMKIAKIFCLPTDYPEGFPTSVLEAAACKSYIITTTAGGSKELICNDEYGAILSMNKEYTVLKDAIEKILEDSERREDSVENCYLRVKQKFSWDTVAEQLENICEAK